jgi:soluble lytic murein transglycosylase-like protein
MPLIRRIGLTIAAILSVHSAAIAEIRLEERDGVLYVTNVEPRQAVVAPQVAPQIERSVPRPPAPYADLIRAAAARHGLAPELVESVVRAESNFNASAVSPKGARGLMQLMPTTAAQLGVRNVFDVRQNIEGGVRHLRYLVDRYGGNLTLALAAYNAGVDAVARHGGVPPYEETRAYVARILRLLSQEGTVRSDAATAGARALYRYEGRGGHVVYSNLPIERLSSATREILLDSR